MSTIENTLVMKGIVALFFLLCSQMREALSCSDSDSYICHLEGTAGLNVIITAPHGGRLKPSTIPSRSHGCFNSATNSCSYGPQCRGREDSTRCRASLLSDRNTDDIAIRLREKICQIMGKCPHLILNRLHRSKMDPNRELEDATQGSAEARNAFLLYHGLINETKQSFCGRSLLLDIHGHAHSKQRAELGYLVFSSALRSGSYEATDTSISSLVFQQRGRLSFNTIFRGSWSLGALMNQVGLRATPSPNEPAPSVGDKYFSGGYTVKVHGSKYAGEMDAIQIEGSQDQRSDAGKYQYADALARAVSGFVMAHEYVRT